MELVLRKNYYNHAKKKIFVWTQFKMAANQTESSKGLSSRFCRLRRANHIKCIERWGRCTKKYILVKKKRCSQKGITEVCYYLPGTKRQSMEWKHIISPFKKSSRCRGYQRRSRWLSSETWKNRLQLVSLEMVETVNSAPYYQHLSKNSFIYWMTLANILITITSHHQHR